MRLNLATWGNALHSGDKTYPIVKQRWRWFALSLVLMAVSITLLLTMKLNPGIDFVGGTQYVIADVADTDGDIARDAVAQVDPDAVPRVTVLGGSDVRVQLGELSIEDARELGQRLLDGYGIDDPENLSTTQIGPSWGEEVSKKALVGLAWFLAFVAAVMWIYFRAWRMAVAALVALAHDLLFTVGIYAGVGFEVTPASVIGFLTILGYSLYDTVVVFDKVRENTKAVTSQHRFTYAELANLAINQTLVRSINTSIVALLPVSAILFVGSYLFGAGTLRDIALALFVGMAVGTYSSIFVATPLEVALRWKEERIVKHTDEVLRLRESGEAQIAMTADGEVKVGALKRGSHQGQRSQPKRKHRS